MFTRKRSALVAMCVLLSTPLFVACCDCCRPGEQPGPQPDGTCCVVCPQASQWQAQIDAGKNAEVIQETTKVIQAGKEAPEYAQALLYRGVAEFRLGDLKSARDDLTRAQDLSSRMSKAEQTLLFRTQMVVLAKLGDKMGAEQAFQKAIEIAPEDQKDAIRKEYENALKPQ